MLEHLIQKDIVSGGLEYLKTRNPRIANVIYQRFYDNATLAALAIDYKLSHARIRQMEAKGLRMMRRYLYKNKIRTFLEIL